MPRMIPGPQVIESAGNLPKRIEEFVGVPSTGARTLSIARMSSPPGWEEPGQRPDFDEYTVVLQGLVVVEFDGGTLDVRAGQAVHTRAGEWVRYRTPGPEGAVYLAVCVPAFTPDTVHRDVEATPA